MDSSSDSIIVSNYAYLTFEDKKRNDQMFLNFVGSTNQECVRDITKESSILIAPSSRVSSCLDATRGGNASSLSLKAGYDAWPGKNMNDFLMVPCEQNTWRNHIESDADKSCSVRHQMFMNLTKKR